MKTIIGIGLVILGIVSLSGYPNLGVNAAETIGAIIGTGLLTFLPAILLIKSANKTKTK